MFAIHHENQVCFQNDISNIMDLLQILKYPTKDCKKVYHWLSNATFDDTFSLEGLSIHCINDTKARKMASFYGVLSEFQKIYGYSFGVAIS